jgi:sugar phosphate isomerase/epimerase
MGEGCIDIPSIRREVENNGFRGFIEVEIFSNRYWSMDQGEFLTKIVQAYKEHV